MVNDSCFVISQVVSVSLSHRFQKQCNLKGTSIFVLLLRLIMYETTIGHLPKSKNFWMIDNDQPSYLSHRKSSITTEHPTVILPVDLRRTCHKI